MKTVIVGCGNEGLLKAREIANKCNIPIVVDSQFTEPKEEKVFEITRLPELSEIWIDPNEPVFNEYKHKQTCTKNRKKKERSENVGKFIIYNGLYMICLRNENKIYTVLYFSAVN